MTTSRADRDAMSVDEALAEIAGGSGSQFDPKVVEVLMAVGREWLSARPQPGTRSPTMSVDLSIPAEHEHLA
jgi:HD-GYP domain-containing protein (c-di-GMP phosphodiesterase class II)